MSAALTSPPVDSVRVDSIVLGEVDVPSASVFAFSKGLHGFEDHPEFALVPAGREGLFWMQSMAMREIAFLMVDPFVASQGYEVDLGQIERTELDINDPSDALVLAIVTLPTTDGAAPTANLRGPVVFNPRTRKARQVLSSMPGHDVQAPVDVLALPPRLA